jgi:hypothetical protein
VNLSALIVAIDVYVVIVIWTFLLSTSTVLVSCCRKTKIYVPLYYIVLYQLNCSEKRRELNRMKHALNATSAACLQR